ncbi:MAG: DUF2541 domain-containing protein [Hyphomicrobium sp.]
MLRRLIAASWAMAALAAVGTAAEARDRLVVIGSGALDSSSTAATIDVSQAKGAYKGFRIIAKKGAVDITGLRFVYNDDTFHTESKAFSLKTGERTRAFDERDASRFIDTVVVNHQKLSGPVELEVIGVQSTDGARRKRSKPAAVAAAVAAPQTGALVTTPTRPEPLAIEPGKIVEGRDVMFGYQSVGFGIDRDTIHVGADVGKFDVLRLRLLENDIRINQLEVVYVDGSRQVLAVDADVKANQKTKWFRVNGNEFIKDIELSYRSKPNLKGQARVEVLGQFADGWLGPQGEGRKFNQGWVLLGSQTAGAFGFDKDKVSVGKNEGGFTKVRLKVRDRSITLREVRVVFLDGSEEVIASNDRVDPDQTAGPWDLKVGRAAIKEIVAKYRTRLVFGKGQGTAVVEFWGQH